MQSFEHYSSFYRLFKHIDWILKLKKNYIQNIRNVEHHDISFKKLDPQDIKLGEYEVYRHWQLEFFAAEINCLKESFSLKKSNLIPLAPFLVNGLIKVGVRIGRTFVTYG